MSWVMVAVGVGLVGSAVLTSAMTQNPSAPPPPKVEPVTPMPIATPDDANIAAARKKSMASQRRRRGRMSTILSDQQDQPLGGL